MATPSRVPRTMATVRATTRTGLTGTRRTAGSTTPTGDGRTITPITGKRKRVVEQVQRVGVGRVGCWIKKRLSQKCARRSSHASLFEAHQLPRSPESRTEGNLARRAAVLERGGEWRGPCLHLRSSNCHAHCVGRATAVSTRHSLESPPAPGGQRRSHGSTTEKQQAPVSRSGLNSPEAFTPRTAQGTTSLAEQLCWSWRGVERTVWVPGRSAV
ncbi:hypothetical protein T484DRAFT_1888482, partial [Baffinella frigidus]